MRARVWSLGSLAEREQLTEEGCYVVELSNTAGDPAVSVARARVRPGGSTQLHRLKDIDERYLIIAGRGRVELDGASPQAVRAGDVVYIPRDTPQRIANTGTEDLLFLCVCTPRFEWSSYEALE